MPTLPFVKFILGGLDLAVCGDLILQGVLFTQFATYVSHGFHRTDSIPVRLWVAALFVFILFRTVYSLVLNYIQNTARFLDLAGAVADYAAVQTALGFLWAALLVLYVQLFLCWRLLHLSGHFWPSLSLAVVFLLVLICWIMATQIFSGSAHSQQWGAAHASMLFIGALGLSAATIYDLLSRKVTRAETSNMLERMTALAIQSALPATFCTVVFLATSQASPSWFIGTPERATAIVTIEILPNLYAFSAMWTLNSQEEMRTGTSQNRNSGVSDVHEKLNRRSAGAATTTTETTTTTRTSFAPQAARTGSSSSDDSCRPDSVADIQFGAPGAGTAAYAAPIMDEEAELGRKYESMGKKSLDEALSAKASSMHAQSRSRVDLASR